LKQRSGAHRDGRPAFADCNLRRRKIGETHYGSIDKARRPRVALGTVGADHKEMFLGQRDRIRVHAVRRERYRFSKGNGIVVPH